MPFPDEWSRELGLDRFANKATADASLEDFTAEPEPEGDERVGYYDHPTRGRLQTYYFENTRNTRLYYDAVAQVCGCVNGWVCGCVAVLTRAGLEPDAAVLGVQRARGQGNAGADRHGHPQLEKRERAGASATWFTWAHTPQLLVLREVNYVLEVA